MRSIGVEALAARLDQRFALLAGQRAGVDPRHRNLQALVEWSYELLDPLPTRRRSPTSRRSRAVSTSTPPRPCAVRPAPDEEARRGVVIDLVDKSMVQLVDPDEPRYRLLETLREFGQERLRDTGSLEPVEERHRAWFLEVAERAAVELDGPDEGRWAARIDRDLDNLRAAHGSAVRAGDLTVAAGLVASLREYSFRRVRYEIAGWGEATMQMDGLRALAHGARRARRRRLRALGAWRPRDRHRPRPSLGRPRRTSLVSPSSGLAERVLGNALFYSGETQQALRWMERMVAVAEASGSPAALAHALYMASVARTSIGETARGAMLAERAAAAAERCGSPTAARAGRLRQRPGAAGERQRAGRAGVAPRRRPRRRGREPVDPGVRADRGALALRRSRVG